MRINCQFLAAAAAGALGVWMAATPASATPPPFNYGAEALATVRNCGPLTASGECLAAAGSSGLRRVDGGTGFISALASVTALSTSPQAGSSASGSAAFGAMQFPELHAISISAGTDSRSDGGADAWHSFTFNGFAPSEFSVAGDLQIDASSLSPADPLLAGGGAAQVQIEIWDTAAFPPDALANLRAQSSCGASGLLGFAFSVTPFAGGGYEVPIATQSCGSGPIMLQFGEQVTVFAQINLIDNRGGFADASHTFTTFLDPSLGADTIANLQANLTPDPVPEPGAWVLMLGGFGLAGAGLRGAGRRRKFA
jgi:hypothetical protein